MKRNMEMFRKTGGYLILAALWLSQGASAADKVLYVGGESVTVTNNTGENFSTNDSVCLYQARHIVACGDIDRIDRKEMSIHTETTPSKVAIGERVYVRPNIRRPSSDSVNEVYEGVEPRKNFDISAGVDVGPSYFFPTAHIQVALGNDVSLGIEPLLVDYYHDNTTVKAYGGFGTINYYYTHSAFRGLFFQAGGGFYSIQNEYASTTENLTTPAVKGTVQWRGRALWGLGLDIGVGAGAQYVFQGGQIVTNKFQGFLPLLTAFLGYSF